jgi:uncharacterized protein YjbI with pentapeptide repeats
MKAFAHLGRTIRVWVALNWNFAPLGLIAEWLKLSPQAAFLTAGAIITILLLKFSGVTAAVAAVAAWIALMRHQAQTDADHRRRITESFSKAIEQLGSDKLEVRLGGIYALERISKESDDDYWTVIENLTAFVRERTGRAEAERNSRPFEKRVELRAYLLWERASRPQGRAEEFWEMANRLEKWGEPPAADIAAVLTIIKRRNEKNRKREQTSVERLYRSRIDARQAAFAAVTGLKLPSVSEMKRQGERVYSESFYGWRLDFSHAVLRRADLAGAHLEDAMLTGAYLEGADLGGAHLEDADLRDAHLEGANLTGAHLEGAVLFDAHLEGASLTHAQLGRALLGGAHLEGADLSGATGVNESVFAAFGDAFTRLPRGRERPPHWPPEARSQAKGTWP